MEPEGSNKLRHPSPCSSAVCALHDSLFVWLPWWLSPTFCHLCGIQSFLFPASHNGLSRLLFGKSALSLIIWHQPFSGTLGGSPCSFHICIFYVWREKKKQDQGNNIAKFSFQLNMWLAPGVTVAGDCTFLSVSTDRAFPHGMPPVQNITFLFNGTHHLTKITAALSVATLSATANSFMLIFWQTVHCTFHHHPSLKKNTIYNYQDGSWIRALARNTNGWRLIPGIHMVEKERWLLLVVLWPLYACCSIYTYICKCKVTI